MESLGPVLTPVNISLALLIGLLTGVLSGALGVGGGIVCTPMLLLLLKLEAHTAVGTTLALIVPTAAAGSINYIKNKLVDFDLVKAMAVPAIAGLVLGSQLSLRIDGHILMVCFAALIAVSGLDLLSGFSDSIKAKRSSPQSAAVQKSGAAAFSKSKHWQNMCAIGLLTGVLAGFFGVGGGFILVPLLLVIYNLEVKRALGTSLMMVALISIPGAILNSVQHHVEIVYAVLMALTAMPASMLGSKVALKLKDSFLRQAFGIVMLILSGVLIWKEWPR